MKIYKTNINIKSSDLVKLEFYNINNINYNIIYSDEGIFIPNKNDFTKCIIVDGYTQHISIADWDFIIDNSNIQYTTVNKIPYNCILVKKIKHIYALDPKSKLQLIIEKSNNIITDIFFETNESIESPLIIKDISTLISLLN